MKKSVIIVALAVLTLGFITACDNSHRSTEKHHKKGKYTCTMHPDVSADKPGLCPKCGMDLVERDTTDDK